MLVLGAELELGRGAMQLTLALDGQRRPTRGQRRQLAH
jgi:hypothetical protein